MSGGRVPSRSEVMEWSPQQLAEYLRKMNLSDCDRTVLKNSINGIRFVNLSDNDLQKFPKLHTPIISKLSADISKKEERRGLFGKKTMTPKFHEAALEVHGLGDNHSDEDDFNDYESPNSGGDDDGSSQSDYEIPNDGMDGTDHYELPPSEPSEDLAHKLRTALPLGEADYIDNRDQHVPSRGPPPAVSPRPPVVSRPTLSPCMPGRDHSPHSSRRPSEKLLPGPPQIFRGNKPGRNSSPIRGPSVAEKPGKPSRRPQVDVPDPPSRSKPPPPPSSSASIGRCNSSVGPPPNRFDGMREQAHNDAPKFTLPHKNLAPRPAPPSRCGDSLPPGVTSVGSLPLSVHSAPNVEGWDDDEFDDEEYTDDYENPNSGDEGNVKSDGDDSPNDNSDWADNYEPPPSEPSEDLNHKPCPALPLGDGDYIDNRDKRASRGPPPAVSLRPPAASLPPLSPRMPGESLSSRDHSPHRARQPSGKLLPEPPQIFRGNKPGRNSSPIRGPNTEERPATQSRRPQVDVLDAPSRSKPPVLPPPSSVSISRSSSSVRPPPSRFDGVTHSDARKHSTFPLLQKNLGPRPAPPSRHGDSLPAGTTSVRSLPLSVHTGSVDDRSNFAESDRFRSPPQKPASRQGLDPRWYVGKVTRSEAEGYLKQVNKDGAYLVRDSSHQQSNQPYTLMVLHQNKVYNIQIRHQDQQFQLGTGLKVQESFPTVCDIIKHYSQCPLLLIDAKKRCHGQQNQCLLSDPAKNYMSGP
ncbi:lymphocyte cytosolic protein 2a isoform X2 [Dunckerocampus dactyliophorus]|uniref:lymphocyte cytosolic protein 2a isoform X2 n=1 Tax=Dunckerocampus dactyliophorus TaxID=161453 RepID=UPI002405310E|nr:lymphocyte cytosolic protein 2a isoform X2 [Dunckerocampus dactyliophorus]